MGHPETVRAERSARHSVSGRVRRTRRHVRDLRQGRRGSRQGVRVERADHRRARAGRAADPHRRQRRTKAALHPQARERRMGRRRTRSPKPVPAPTRPARCACARAATATTTCSTARRSGSRRAASPTSSPSSPSPIPTRAPNGISAFVVEKGTPGFAVGKLEKKMGIRGSPTVELVFTELPRAGGEHARPRRRRLQDRHEGARQIAPRDRRASARHRDRRARLRDRVSQGTHRVRQAARAAAGPAVHAGRHEDRSRGGAAAALRSRAQVRRRAPTISPRGRRSPSSSAATSR